MVEPRQIARARDPGCANSDQRLFDCEHYRSAASGFQATTGAPVVDADAGIGVSVVNRKYVELGSDGFLPEARREEEA